MSQSSICLDADVQLGNLVLNTYDSDGTLWVITDIEGWWTLPEPEIPDYPMGADDGSYEAAGRYNARVFSLNGIFIPKSHTQVAAARAKLIRTADLCRKKTWFLTRQSDGVTRGSEVVLSGAPMISTLNAQGRTEFSIGLKAPDPIKYAINEGTPPGWFEEGGSGTVVITNEGDYPVKPIITVSSASAGATITNANTGEVVKFREPTSGVTIDSRMRSVVAGTTTNQRKVLEWDTDWLSLAPGDNVLTASGVSFTVKWRHGWIG